MRSIIIIFLIILLGYGGYIFYFNYYSPLQPVINNKSITYEVRDPDIPNIKIMTYNINHGLGSDGISDLNRISEIIKPAQIIALNEVDNNLLRSKFVDQSRWLGEKTGLNHVFGPALLNGIGSYGNALLTVFPILDAKNYKLPTPRNEEPRGLLEVVLRLSEDRKLTVLVTHLSINCETRQKQIQWIKDKLVEIDHSYILLGDFNQSPVKFKKSVLLSESKKSFPAIKPVLAIDHIYGSNDLQLTSSVEVISDKENAASDHIPIMVNVY